VLSLVLGACPAPPADPPLDTTWHEAFDATSTGWLLSIWGPAPDDLYAAGGEPGHGVLVHFDGDAWAEVTLPEATPLLSWLYGFSTDDFTLVGDGGTILHFDGQSFTAQASSTDENLWGVWGATHDDLWAVGGGGRSGDTATLVHFDGASWSPVDLPPFQKANVRALYKVWGTGADNVYAVGQYGTVLHYDGNAWKEELVGANDDLISLWGTSPSNIYAVGGRGNGIISRFDGSEWHTEGLAPLPGLNGVFMRAPNVVHVVGITGTIATIDATTLQPIAQDPWSTALDLHATFAIDGKMYAVGGSFASLQPPYEGLALERGLDAEE